MADDEDPPTAETLGEELLPADDAGSTPEADVEAAIASALAPDYASLPGTGPEPIGFTWRFNFEKGEFDRRGTAPAEAHGLDSIEVWVLTVMHTARWAHGIFSDAFGIEEPHSMIGDVDPRPALRRYEENLRAAVTVHNRITDMTDFVADFDPATGLINIENFEVVLDDQARLSLIGPILVRPED